MITLQVITQQEHVHIKHTSKTIHMCMYGATNPPTQRLATVYVNINGVQNSFTSSTYLGKPTVEMWAM